MDPIRCMVQEVIRASEPDGRTTDYFRNNPWEQGMRRSFAEMVQVMRSGQCLGDDLALKNLIFLNGRYMTRFRSGHLSALADVIVEEIRSRGWLDADHPSIFHCSDGEATKISQAIPDILQAIVARGMSRPYSLLTKYLHFCFPSSFPIYDMNAALSIQMWSYLEFANRGLAWKVFSQRKISATDGSGYAGIVAFYRRFREATTAEDRTQMDSHAADLSGMVGAEVSLLDLVDKMLWAAAGDPLKLGLRCSFSDGRGCG